MRRMVTTLLLPVLAGAQDVIVLRNGQSTVGEFLSGGRMTYHFDLPADSQSDVAIAVTPLSGSDPDLCISQTITRPDPLTGTCRWSGDSAGADRVLIPAAELDVTRPLYVGVLDGGQGGVASTSFAVLVTLDPSGVCSTVGGACVLVPGVPQRLVMAQYYSDAFLTVAASGHEGADLQISAVRTYGDPDLYVSAGPAATPRWPQTGSGADWSAIDSGDDLITIRGDEARACGQAYPEPGQACTYFVHVRAWGATAADVTATFVSASAEENQPTRLQEGVPFRGVVGSEQYLFFEYSLSSLEEEIAVTLTPLTGDPDLYASFTQQRPREGSATWQARRERKREGQRGREGEGGRGEGERNPHPAPCVAPPPPHPPPPPPPSPSTPPSSSTTTLPLHRHPTAVDLQRRPRRRAPARPGRRRLARGSPGDPAPRRPSATRQTRGPRAAWGEPR